MIYIHTVTECVEVFFSDMLISLHIVTFVRTELI